MSLDSGGSISPPTTAPFPAFFARLPATQQAHLKAHGDFLEFRTNTAAALDGNACEAADAGEGAEGGSFVRVITAAGCEAAAKAQSKNYGGQVNVPSAPKGCMEYIGDQVSFRKVYLNMHTMGGANVDYRLVCRRLPVDGELTSAVQC